MINWTERHRDIVCTERRAILMEGATRDQFVHGQWPTGSLWLWTLGIAGPKNSAIEADKRYGE